MIYFFHHYELPAIIQQAQVQQILRLRTRQRHQQQNGNGAANNAANARNTPNAANQTNNDVIGGNQMINNNGNNPNRNIFRNISLVGYLQLATALFNHLSSAFGALQGRLINDVLGTAALFNNNNSLNNNNNNPTANITRLHINLSRVQRINLTGVQINPVQINQADGTENISHNRDESAGSASESHPLETPTSQCSDTNHTADEANEMDFDFHREMSGDLPAERKFETEDEFDIIDKNEEMDLKNSHELRQVFAPMDEPQTSNNLQHILTNDETFHRKGGEGTSHSYDVQIQSIDCRSPNAPHSLCDIARNDSRDAHPQPNSISVHRIDSKQSAELISAERRNWTQGDRDGLCLTDVNTGNCTELDDLNTLSPADRPAKSSADESSTNFNTTFNASAAVVTQLATPTQSNATKVSDIPE